MQTSDTDVLLDLIYEAAVVPELWPVVLDRLSKVARCFGGILASIDAQHQVRYLVSEPLQGFMNAFVNDGWNIQNIRFERLAPKKYPGFMTDLDLITRAEMDNSPYYNEFVRPNGGGWATGTIISSPSNDNLVFNLERRYEDGPIEREVCWALDRLRPHLARASLMSARLRMERAQGMTDSLSAMGLPSAVLMGDGKICATNSLFDQIGTQVISKAFGRIALANSNANALLVEAIRDMNSMDFQIGAKSIAVPSDGINAAMIVHLIPVRRSAHDVFGQAMSILVVTPLASAGTLSDDLLNGLFDLSPAETRVAQGLLAGRTINSLSDNFGLSRETIRTQVKAVLSKTGTTRQVEFIALLANLSNPTWHVGRVPPPT